MTITVIILLNKFKLHSQMKLETFDV